MAHKGWADKKKLISLLLAVVIILVNLWMSPINGMAPKAIMGVYIGDTAEHYYPYREALDG
jgi:hypothetical protein